MDKLSWRLIGQGGRVLTGRKYDNVAVVTDSRRVTHYISRSGDELFHQAKGSKNPYPKGEMTTFPHRNFQGNPCVRFESGQIRVDCPVNDDEGGIRGYYINMNEIPDPSEEPPPKLKVQGEQFCFRNEGTIPVKLCGASLFNAFAYIKKLIGYPHQHIDYRFYMDEITAHPQNYVRHGTVNDLDLIREHCIELLSKEIIVELNIWNSQAQWEMPDPLEVIDATIDLVNVFYDVNCEFTDDFEDIAKARQLCNYIKEKGGISCAGAWGFSTHGEAYSEEFDPVNSNNSVISVHRNWDKNSISNYTGEAKPVIRNEYFDYGAGHAGQIGFEGFKRIMRESFEAGAQGVQYYPFIDSLTTPDHGRRHYHEYAEFASQVCEEQNLS